MLSYRTVYWSLCLLLLFPLSSHDTGERELVEDTDFYHNPWHAKHKDGDLFLDMEREGEDEGKEAAERLVLGI